MYRGVDGVQAFAKQCEVVQLEEMQTDEPQLDTKQINDSQERAKQLGGLFATGTAPMDVSGSPVGSSQDTLDRMIANQLLDSDEGNMDELADEDAKTSDMEDVNENQGYECPNMINIAILGDGLLSHPFTPGVTVGQMGVAMSKTGMIQSPVKTTTAMGSPVTIQEQLKEGSFLQSMSIGDEPQWYTTMSTQPPVLWGKPRGILLWEQRGWTSMDELEYYMYMVECRHPGATECLNSTFMQRCISTCAK